MTRSTGFEPPLDLLPMVDAATSGEREIVIDSELPTARLAERGPVSADFLRRGVDTFADAVRYVWRSPYGRNSDRSRWDLVLTEGCGTCSTKHALLAVLAREQDLDVNLVLAIFEMDEANTPGVGAILNKYGLRSMPEAHCFLRWQGIIDVTMPPDNPVAEPKRFIHEEIIEPDQIGDYKVNDAPRLCRSLACAAWARRSRY